MPITINYAQSPFFGIVRKARASGKYTTVPVRPCQSSRGGYNFVQTHQLPTPQPESEFKIPFAEWPTGTPTSESSMPWIGDWIPEPKWFDVYRSTDDARLVGCVLDLSHNYRKRPRDLLGIAENYARIVCENGGYVATAHLPLECFINPNCVSEQMQSEFVGGVLHPATPGGLILRLDQTVPSRTMFVLDVETWTLNTFYPCVGEDGHEPGPNYGNLTCSALNRNLRVILPYDMNR